jgi:hypothetical protein
MDILAGIWDASGMDAYAVKAGNPAPWADVVPDMPLMTIEDLLNYSDEAGWRYELVAGVLVRSSS